MSAVPPKTLEWLYRVLTSVRRPSFAFAPVSQLLTNGKQNRHDPRQAYVDPNRTYNDVAHLLAQNPHFSPRTDVYS